MHTHTAWASHSECPNSWNFGPPFQHAIHIFGNSSCFPCPTAGCRHPHTHTFHSCGIMRRTFQAAVVLCYHTSATAFVSPSAALPSRTAALRRSSTSRSSWLLAHQGLNEQRHAASSTTALRAGLDGDGSDAEAAMKKLLQEDFGANVAIDPKRVAVLFDFDGTIGDTETPAMEVAYWELAPYFPESASKRKADRHPEAFPFGLRARLLCMVSNARE